MYIIIAIKVRLLIITIVTILGILVIMYRYLYAECSLAGIKKKYNVYILLLYNIFLYEYIYLIFLPLLCYCIGICFLYLINKYFYCIITDLVRGLNQGPNRPKVRKSRKDRTDQEVDPVPDPGSLGHVPDPRSLLRQGIKITYNNTISSFNYTLNSKFNENISISLNIIID